MSASRAAKASKEKTAEQEYSRGDGYAEKSASTGIYGDVMDLQRTAGNRAVNQALKSGATNPERIQGNLTVSQPGDKYEREADRIADHVVRMPEGVGSEKAPFVTPIQTQSIQRDISPDVFREQSSSVTPDVQTRIESLQHNTGEPLPKNIRDFMEPRFGRNLSAIRIHRNSEANSLAAKLKAKAFTVGNDIAFARGQFSSSKSVSRELLAHELVHAQQQQTASHYVIQRAPEDEPLSDSSDIETNNIESEEHPNQIPSEDLVKANSKLEKELNKLNYKMEIVLRALFGEQRGEEDIFESDVSQGQLKKARRAVSRYRRITRILEGFPQLDIAFAAKWLNVLMFTVRVLRQTLNELLASGEVGALIAEAQDRQLRRIFNRARKLRSKKVIKRGAKLAKAAEETAEQAQLAESERKLPEALARITSDIQRQTVGISDIEIDIEIQQLLFKKQLEIDPVKIQVINAIIEGLESGKVEGRKGPEATITDQAKEIVKAALNDTSQASRIIVQRLKAQSLDLRSLTVVLDAFRLLNDESETRVDVIREQVLMQLGPEALLKLSNAKEGSQAEIIFNWLAPNSRKDLQFAVSFAKEPVGNVQIDDLLAVKDSERPDAVVAAVRSVSSKSLRRLARSRDGRKLLIEMAFQLWARGHSKPFESVGDELANAVAPSRGFTGETVQLPALPGIALGIRTSGRKMVVSMDSLDIEQAVAAGFGRRYVLKLFTSGIEIDPEDVIAIRERADEAASLMPALKLLEMKARGDKTLLGLAALKLRESAEEAKDIISSNALNLIKAQERKLEDSVDKARKYLFENVPEEYRLEALTALEIFADAGRFALTAEAQAIGSAVGITKGAIDLGTGAVETAGLVTETASDINRAAEEGHVFDELKVKADDVSKTVKVTMVVAPEQVGKAIQNINNRLARAGIAEKALIVSEIEGRIAFEVATTVAGARAPSVLGRLKGLKRLPSKPDLRAPRRPSSKDIPDTERIIGKGETGSDVKGVGSRPTAKPDATESKPFSQASTEKVIPLTRSKPPPKSAASKRNEKILEKVQKGKSDNVAPLRQRTPDKPPTEPAQKDIPLTFEEQVAAGQTHGSGVETALDTEGPSIPEASIKASKARSKHKVSSTSTPSPSIKTRSLPPPGRTASSASHTTRPVIEQEGTLLEDLLEQGDAAIRRESLLDELLREEVRRRKLSPEKLAKERQKEARETAIQLKKNEDLVDEFLRKKKGPAPANAKPKLEGTKQSKTVAERFGKQISPEEASGITKRQRQAAKRLFTGKGLAESKSTERLAEIWTSVAKPGDANRLTKSNSRRLFDNQRNRFWRKVRKDPAAVQMFEDMGARFPKGRSSAPVLRLPNGKETRITVDHIVERQTAPGRALDPSNLRFSTTKENTVLLRQITEQDPFQ